ncbi:MAG: hypothetical protein J5I47_13780 [Vicingus serpentipes]|nr:hypothetical protein [Vicingus serpentipes]
MKKTITLIILLISTLQIIYSQDNSTDILKVTVYNTFEDFVNQKGEYVGHYDNFLVLIGGRTTLTVKNNGKKSRVAVSNKWGYKIGNNYYRSMKKYPMLIAHVGKTVYYENGKLHMRTIKDGNGWCDANETIQLFSETLTSEAIEYRKFKKKYQGDSSLKKLFDCLEEKKRNNNFSRKIKRN